MNDTDRLVLEQLRALRGNYSTEHEVAYQLRRDGRRVGREALRLSLDRLVAGGHAERGTALGLPVWAATGAREAVSA